MRLVHQLHDLIYSMELGVNYNTHQCTNYDENMHM